VYPYFRAIVKDPGAGNATKRAANSTSVSASARTRLKTAAMAIEELFRIIQIHLILNVLS